MKEYIEILKKCNLFKGIKEKDIENILLYLKPAVKKYHKGDFIFLAGNPVNNFAIVLNGNIHIIKESFYGSKSIIADCSASDMFAEALSCIRIQHSPVSVIAKEISIIMFIDFTKVLNGHSKAMSVVLQNMLSIIAKKNIFLNMKLTHISKRNTREKLLSYLQDEQLKTGKEKFTIPFTKTDLADYLFVDRAAMTRELSNMKKEKLIDFTGNEFCIKKIKETL